MAIKRPLTKIRLNFLQQRYEADFRFNLVRVRENSEQIALLGGEAAESDRRLSAKSGIRPLEGLPVTIKECISTEGLRSTVGMKMLEHNVLERDAPTVARST